ncbi:MAG: hypothetical protein GMKNLPBB_02831 [Myxococcota bacterium]|nr:hypothetical protein [Myxococcota bacterium]
MRLDLLTLAALLVTPGAAEASALFELAGDPHALNSLNARVLEGGSVTAFFNPALLPWNAKSFSSGAAALGYWNNISYGERPAGAEIPDSIYNARLARPANGDARLRFRPYPTARTPGLRGSENPSNAHLFLSIHSTAHLVERYLSFGFYAWLPAHAVQAQRPFFVDEREQFFSNSLKPELWGDRLETNILGFALGSRPLDWLAVGAGLTMTTHSTARTSIYMPDGSQQDRAEINAEVVVKTSFIPHFGIVLEPVDPLRLTATLHMPFSSRVDGESTIRFWTDQDRRAAADGTDITASQPARQEFEFTYGSSPWRASLGAAWRGGAQLDDQGFTWTAVAHLLLTTWSGYRDRRGANPSPGWSNTLTPSIGVRLQWFPHALGIDLSYSPSPVPAQTGRSNYVDNDRLAAAIGYEAAFDLFDIPCAGGLNLQLQHLLKRSHVKDPAQIPDEFPDSVNLRDGQFIPASAGLQTNNPGYPGFSSSGWMAMAGASFKIFY